MVKQISDNELYLLIKYIKSVLWRVAKGLSYIEDVRCLQVKHGTWQSVQWVLQYVCFLFLATFWCPAELHLMLHVFLLRGYLCRCPNFPIYSNIIWGVKQFSVQTQASLYDWLPLGPFWNNARDKLQYFQLHWMADFSFILPFVLSLFSFSFFFPSNFICLLLERLTLILRRSRTGTVWFYTSTSNKRAARPKLYKKSLTRELKRMYSRLTLVRISINL